LSLVLYDPAQIGIEIPIPQPKGKGVKYRTKTASSTSMERSTARARLNQFTHRPLVAAGLSLAQGAPASTACVVLAGTADGFDKETAVSRAQLALDDYIQQYKTEHHLGAVSVSPCVQNRSLIGEAG
jgi:hypothetical protein